MLAIVVDAIAMHPSIDVDMSIALLIAVLDAHV